MLKKTITFLFITIALFITAETVYIGEPDLVNVNEKMYTVIPELLKIEISKFGLSIMDSLTENTDYILNSKVVRFEDNRAYLILQLMKDNKLENEVSRIITAQDKLDIFVSRALDALINRKEFKETKEYGKTISEEETLSDLEEPFKFKSSLGIGAHLGTLESRTPDYSYLPVFVNLAGYFIKPDYMLSVQTLSPFQALGLKIGGYKIHSRNVHSIFYGGAFGVGVFWGPSNTVTGTSIDPFFAPTASLSIGGLINRTSTVVVKPELELGFQMRKGTTIQFISELNILLSLLF